MNGWKYSQTSHKRTPLGPSIAVHLWEVSAYGRLKTRKHYRGQGMAVMPSNSCLRLVHMKFILIHKICNKGKIVPKKSYLGVTDGRTLTAWPFSLLLSI